jgi:hypothetical protein
VYHPACIAVVRDHCRETLGDAGAPLRLGQQHHPSVGCDPSAIEGGAHLLARYRWQVEGQGDILIHKSLPLHDHSALAASATGIMLHIHVSHYVQLVARADEIIKPAAVF